MNRVIHQSRQLLTCFFTFDIHYIISSTLELPFSLVVLYESSSVQNNLIHSTKEVILFDKIKSEINVTDFIAKMIDETSHCSKKSQLIMIFR